jgi:hypothetical protein
MGFMASAFMVTVALLWAASPAFAAVPAAAQNLGFQTLLEALFPAPVASPLTREAAALTRRGISPARAGEAIAVEGAVADRNLVNSLEHRLADAYAGAWFEPATAKLHIGVTSDATSQVASRTIANAGLGTDVIVTYVRSTWAALNAAQKRWDAKLIRLLGPGESMTGISSQRNAVVVKLSSSVPVPRRAVLERAAAKASVNVLITIVPPSELHVQYDGTECEFVKGVKGLLTERAAWCEKTITSGVQIEGPLSGGRNVCTAGPMMMRGFKTFVLTAGHCVEKVKDVWESEYPNPNPPHTTATKKLGEVTARTFNKTVETAEIEVERPGKFNAGLPTPVPALIAEWGNWEEWTNKPPEGEPITPIATRPGTQFESRVVSGESAPVEGFADCHEGRSTGEQCGVTGMTNVNPGGGIEQEHLVEDKTCAETGDSGGPFFYHSKHKYYMEGVLLGALKKLTCTNEGKNGTAEGGGEPVVYFEPLKTVLAAYPNQRLLTTENELRIPRAKGGKGASLTKKDYTSSSGASTIEAVGGSKMICTASSGKGEASAESSGTAKLTLTGCEAFSDKCHTSGAAEGEVALSANYKLDYTNGSEDEVGLLLELSETAIECGKNCEGKAVETLKLRGTGIGATTPIDEEVVPSKKFTITFSQSKGVQKPTEYETDEGSKVKDILELSGSGTKAFSFEQAGISDTDELLFEETAEIEA